MQNPTPPRRADDLVEGSSRGLGSKLKFIANTHIALWKVLLLVVFISGFSVMISIIAATGRVGVYSSSSAATGVYAFAERNGVIVIEAENFDQKLPGIGGTHQWTPRVRDPQPVTGYSGKGYMHALPDTPEAGADDARLISRVQAVSEGPYYIWVRGRGSNDHSDSVSVGIVGGAEYTVMEDAAWRSSSFVWSDRQASSEAPTVLSLSNQGGVQYLIVQMHDDGFRFDKIVLTKDPAFRPTGNGPQQSKRVRVTVLPPAERSNLKWNSDVQLRKVGGTEPPALGDAIWWGATMKNDGTVAVPGGWSWQSKIWVNGEYLGRDTHFTGMQSLAAAATKDVATAQNSTGDNLIYDPAKTYRVCLIVDSQGTVQETKEDDNELCKTIPGTVSLPTVTVTAVDAEAGETTSGQQPNPGMFSVERTGPTSEALMVTVSISGSAWSDDDFQWLPGVVTINPGSSASHFFVMPVDDTVFEEPEQVVMTLQPGEHYTRGTLFEATVVITDNDPLSSCVLFETLSVNSVSDQLTSGAKNTVTGKIYRLTATGTYQYRTRYPELVADAEWANNLGAPDTWTNHGGLDLVVNEEGHDWGDYNPSHVYQLTVLGSGQKLSLRIHDSYYPDNAGSLSVRVEECSD